MIGLTCTFLLADVAARAWSSLALREMWHQNGLALLTVFWLANVVLASWIEAPSRFVGAMVLQWVVILLIWISLLQWLIFLERLLVGGWITALCAVLLPLGTALQLYGDPAAGRQSVRRLRTSGDLEASNGTPQFTLRGLLNITTLCAVVLATCQVWGLEAAAFSVYASTMALLALRRLCFARGAGERARVRRALAGWYSLAACLLAAGGLLAA